jgi:hypothetical protein
MPNVVGRAREETALRELLASTTGRRLAWMQGRRGLGKTFLLLNAWPAGVRVFHFSAGFTTAGQNRQALADAVFRFTGRLPENTTPGSLAQILAPILAPITSPSRRAPTVLILDNCDFLTDGRLPSVRALGHEIAEWLGRGTATDALPETAAGTAPHAMTDEQVLLVLCGGMTEMREMLAGPDAPLSGQFDWTCDLPPLDYWSTLQLAPYTSPRDRTVLYAVFGSAPQYVAHLRPTGGITDNIARLCLARHGAVRQTVESALLREPGIRDHATYHALLRAMGAGCSSVADIHRAAMVPRDSTSADRSTTDLTATRAKLERLIALGYVRRERNFGARHTQAFRYLLEDSAFAFHYTFVPQHEALLERTDPRVVYDQHIAPRFDEFVTVRLTNLATQAYDRLQPIRRLPVVAEWGWWEGRTGSRRQQRERRLARIDLIARLDDDRVMTGGLHWHPDPVGAAAFAQHLEVLRGLAEAGEAWAERALRPDAPVLWVSAAGFREDFARAIRATHRESILLSLDALFRK